MLDPKVLDDLARRVAEALPSGLTGVREDLEKNARAALQGALARLDLVSREDYEVQAGVLARTRAKVEELEKQVGALEARLREGRPGEPPGRN